MSKHNFKFECTYEADELDVSPDRVIVMRVDLGNMPPALRADNLQRLQSSFKHQFPDNKLIVVSNKTSFDSLSIEELKKWIADIEADLINSKE